MVKNEHKPRIACLWLLPKNSPHKTLASSFPRPLHKIAHNLSSTVNSCSQRKLLHVDTESERARKRVSQSSENKAKEMDDRLAAAQRRKLLMERQRKFDRAQQQQHKDETHKAVVTARREDAKTAAHPEAAEYENYYCSSGSGSAWRSREHVSLKNSPRNVRAPTTPAAQLAQDAAKKQRSLKDTKPISDTLYARLSFQRTKQSQAEHDEVL